METQNINSITKRKARDRFVTAAEADVDADVDVDGGDEADQEEEVEEEDDVPKSYAAIHRAQEAKATAIEFIAAAGGSYAMKYLWRQVRTESSRVASCSWPPSPHN